MLKFRIISGCLMGGGFLLSLFLLPMVGMWLMALLITTLGILEFYGMMNRAGIPVFRVCGALCGATLITVTFLTEGGAAGSVAEAGLWERLVMLGSLMLVLLRLFPQKDNPQPLATLGCTLLGIWYVPYLFNFFSRLALEWDAGWGGRGMGPTGVALVLYMVLVVKMTDIGAYCTGMLIGRHKCFPRISPKKTWEGLAGGLAVALLTSLTFWWMTGGRMGRLDFPAGHAVCLGLFLFVVAVVGDLFESLIKRASGAKDSSSLIPGMGGVLDVFDSLLFGAPAMYVYASLFLR